MLDQLDKGDYASDEFFFQTLLASNNLNSPNTFPYKCVKQNDVPHITRFTIWYNTQKCYSNNRRHNMCIFGLEDLWHYAFNSKYLFLNKMMPEIDFGAIICWHEEMRRRTLIEKGINRINATIYQNLPQTRFHQKWKRTLGKVNIKEFKCEIK
ncbi:hypothetical protein Mgra_00006968 [Meloidogyne graminicola]|uniref:Uncharacterized protein n=1 Tax=Meloidogyne graminicola TaxID=189291 RepID=A0A8S9ZK32_9BILA|nr:hypothetical protein Mgra_00006968 [Meloidogyne graminicola]